MTLALAGRLLVDGALREGAVLIAGGRIEAVLDDPPPGARRFAYVAPGFVDLQVNGAFGVEAAAGAARISARLPSTGVTAWLPTLVTSTAGEYTAALGAFAVHPGAQALGWHLEGPLLSPDRAGAHRRAPMQQSPAVIEALAASGDVRLVTLAPERPGAIELVRRLVAQGVVVAVGHTGGTAEDVAQAADAGASLVTHLYNAMPPLSARAPGPIAQALIDDRLTCALIVDGVHVDRAAVELAVRAKGAARIVLVTDAMAAAGAGPGRFQLGGLEVVVDERSARLPDGTLAGSILTLDAAVRNAASTTSLGVAGALAAASEHPARVLGLGDRGRLRAGLRADVVCLDEQLRVLETYVAGTAAFTSSR